MRLRYAGTHGAAGLLLMGALSLQATIEPATDEGWPQTGPPRVAAKAASAAACRWVEQRRQPLTADGLGEVYLDLVQIARVGDEILLAGVPSFIWPSTTGGADPGPPSVDEIVGVLLSPDGSVVESIQAPRAMDRAVGLRVLPDGGDGWAFLWADVVSREEGPRSWIVEDLWVGHYRSGVWTGVHSVTPKVPPDQHLDLLNSVAAAGPEGGLFWVFGTRYSGDFLAAGLTVYRRVGEAWSTHPIHTGLLASGIPTIHHPRLGQSVIVSQRDPDAITSPGQALVAYGLEEGRTRELLVMTGSRSTSEQIAALTSNDGVHLSWATPEGVRYAWLPASALPSDLDPPAFGGPNPEIRIRPDRSGHPFWFVLEPSRSARSVLRIFSGEDPPGRAPELVAETHLPAPYHFQAEALDNGDWLVVSWLHSGVKVTSVLIRGAIECEAYGPEVH